MKGGIGQAALTVNGITVGAIVAVNAVGDVVDPGTGRVVAGARSADGSTLLGTTQAFLRGELPAELWRGAATTIGVVVTDARLDKAGATKLAQMAHDGLARSINPVHTVTDGDTIFALATGASGQAANLTVLGSLAAEATAMAVLRAVHAAEAIGGAGLPSVPAARDFA
jgi:L-aminopeptidase/D-esterase-like protein